MRALAPGGRCVRTLVTGHLETSREGQTYSPRASRLGFRIAGFMLLASRSSSRLPGPHGFPRGRGGNSTRNPHRVLGSIALVGLFSRAVPHYSSLDQVGPGNCLLLPRESLCRRACLRAIRQHKCRKKACIHRHRLVDCTLADLASFRTGLTLLGIGELAQRILRPQAKTSRGPQRLPNAYCLN
jgi:hypothetical protein